jgi:hypothetical protein
MRTPSARSARQEVGDAALGFELVEQPAHLFQVLHRLEVVEQIGVAAHDQPVPSRSPPDQLAKPAATIFWVS